MLKATFHNEVTTIMNNYAINTTRIKQKLLEMQGRYKYIHKARATFYFI